MPTGQERASDYTRYTNALQILGASSEAISSFFDRGVDVDAEALAAYSLGRFTSLVTLLAEIGDIDRSVSDEIAEVPAIAELRRHQAHGIGYADGLREVFGGIKPEEAA